MARSFLKGDVVQRIRRHREEAFKADGTNQLWKCSTCHRVQRFRDFSWIAASAVGLLAMTGGTQRWYGFPGLPQSLRSFAKTILGLCHHEVHPFRRHRGDKKISFT